ncbi:hypothetical protein [Streptomyces odontomachi]|uniref:hypothetical protein n=1 Tax=Streptomyces odontomachi TaxID=2944940 RepID=UPI00210B272D|nr:hypothetical protein [Streptomyces sp. ODS25]
MSSPIMLTPQAYRELCDVAVRCVAILEKSFRSLGTTPAARARRLGVDWDAYRAAHPYFLPDPAEELWSAAVARPDLVFSDTGPKLLEANIGTALGGVAQCDLLRSFWAGPSGMALSSDDPKVMEGLARLVLEYARATGVEPRAALLGLPEYQSPDARGGYRFEAAALRARGIDAEAVGPGELLRRMAARPGSPWPLALRRNRPDRWRSARLGSTPLRRLVARGCHVLCPQSAFLMADKRLLALVSTGRVPLDREEAAFVERYVPWTRAVHPGTVAYQGDVMAMEKLLLARRDAFVLKRGAGRGGVEVIAGREQVPERWAAAVRGALHAGDWIVQEFQDVVPATLPVATAQGAAGSRRFSVVLSPFVVLGRTHGCVTRCLNADGPAVISTTAGATANIALPAART